MGFPLLSLLILSKVIHINVSLHTASLLVPTVRHGPTAQARHEQMLGLRFFVQLSKRLLVLEELQLGGNTKRKMTKLEN